MNARFDIIVAGAGPAGSAAAIVAARAGLRCGLLDRAVFPREKLCGGLFTGRSVAALLRGFDETPDPTLFLRCDRMRFLDTGRVLSDFHNAPPVYLTLRRDMDAWLRDLAVAAGAIPLCGTVTGVDEAGQRITLREGGALEYRVLIGADGVNSAVARSLFGRAYDPATIGFGLEVEAPHDAHPPGDRAVDVEFSAADWGYGWRFPKRHSTTIGVGGVASRNADMKAHMRAYCDQLGVAPDAARVKGHFLPFGDFRKEPGRGAVLLVGDAAGFVDPITGEGIALALESGALAAEAGVAAIHSGRPERAYAGYHMSVRPIQRALREARFWRRMIFSPAFRPAFLKAFSGSSLPEQFLHLLAGEIDYPDLRRALARRFPRAAWKALGTRIGQALR